MQQNLQNRTALVTGGARGLGRAIALELARAGAAVVVADLNLEEAASVADEIRALDRESSGREALVHEALALPLDVTSSASVDRCVADALVHFSRIDILVNNAGVFQRRLGFEVDDDDFNRCLQINLTGIWRMVRALVPHFRSQGSGKIINISSVGGRQGVDFAPAYCASKAGVISLTQSLARALGGDSINVNTVCPGSIPTPMREEIKAMRGERRAERLPLAEPLTAQDIGHAVVFFASDYARNITGQALNVDCGEFMS